MMTKHTIIKGYKIIEQVGRYMMVLPINRSGEDMTLQDIINLEEAMDAEFVQLYNGVAIMRGQPPLSASLGSIKTEVNVDTVHGDFNVEMH